MDFMKKNIKFEETEWLNELQEIINRKNLDDIRLKLNNNAKVEAVIKYLIKENDILKYKTFIKIWKKIDPSAASQFQKNLKEECFNQGLLDNDNNIKVSVSIITHCILIMIT